MSNLFKNKQVVAICSVGGALTLTMGVLGVLSWMKGSEHADANANNLESIKSLGGAKIAPTPQNLKELTNQLNRLNEKVETLKQKQFAPFLQELEPMGVAECSAYISDNSREFADYASQRGVVLPERFMLGFGLYNNKPILANATGIIRYELDATKWLCQQAIESGANEIFSLYREQLDEEKIKKEEVDSGKKTRKSASKPKADKTPRKLAADETVKPRFMPLELTIKTDRKGVAKLLGAIANNEEYFFGVRGLRIGNTQINPPTQKDYAFVSKAAEGVVDEFAALEGQPAAPAGPQTVAKCVVGDQQVIVHLALDLVILPIEKKAN